MLRYAVGVGLEQRLGWGCPHCDTEARAHFSVNSKEVEADFKSDDIEIIEGEEPIDGMLGVNLYTDIPTHESSQGKGLRDGGSAWLQLMRFMEEDGYSRYVDSKEKMQSQREHAYPMIRRAATHYKHGDWVKVRNQLSELAKEAGMADLHPAYVFSRVADMLFIPLLDFVDKTHRGQEILDVLSECRAKYPKEYRQQLNDMFVSQGFPEAMVRCVDTFIRFFDSYDALLLPLATENFTGEWRGKIDEFRSFRDDFDALKATYVDLFESLNQLLLWIGAFLNLAKRGMVTQWANGKVATFSVAKKWRAVDREFIIDELPACKVLVALASRDFRNKIGHYSVRLDIKTGFLVFADGSRQNLLEFHEDYLSAARLLSVLLTFCEKVTLEHEAEVLGTNMDGWAKRKK